MKIRSVFPMVLGVYVPTPMVRKEPKQPRTNNSMKKFSDQVVGEARWLFEFGDWSIEQISSRYNMTRNYVRSICVDGLRVNIDPIKPEWFK